MTAVSERPTVPRLQAGRPRNPELDASVLEAVRSLLVEEGYDSLSINKVTQRCGVHVRTIARRWSTKAEMVAAAILGGDDPLHGRRPPSLPTGGLRRDLRQLIEGNLRYLAEPATRAALPALQGEMLTDEAVRDRFRQRQQEWAALVAAVLRQAVESGDAPERILERGRLLPSILGGATFHNRFLAQPVADDALVDELTDFVVSALLAS